MIGSLATKIAKGGSTECRHCWQWGIRATPLIGLLTLIGLAIGVDEPVKFIIFSEKPNSLSLGTRPS